MGSLADLRLVSGFAPPWPKLMDPLGRIEEKF